MKFRFHVLGLPHTITSLEYNACAFTMKVYKFCKMMHARGHHIIHYGHEKSEVQCSEHVTLIKASEFEAGQFGQDKTNFFEHSTTDRNHLLFNERGTREVVKRVKQGDFLLAFWGSGHQAIADAAEATGKCIAVEPGIGYPNSSFKYRIFESYAIMHNTYGLQNIVHPSWYHSVIPNYFDVDEFLYKNNEEKEDFFLYLGRICEIKGLKNIIEITAKTGQQLVVAGQGKLSDLGYETVPNHVKYVGYADIEKRKQLMSRAKGFFLLTNYIEPFGGAAVEAMLSGTPVITTDWGVFNETVQHGVTGWRCRTMEQLEWATLNIHQIDTNACYQWARSNYGFDKIAPMYEEFFRQLNGLWTDGWYGTNYQRQELTWLKVDYPLSNKEAASSCIRPGPYENLDFFELYETEKASLAYEADYGKGLVLFKLGESVVDAYTQVPSRPGLVKIKTEWTVASLVSILQYYSVKKIATVKLNEGQLDDLLPHLLNPTNLIVTIGQNSSISVPKGYRKLGQIDNHVYMRLKSSKKRIAIFSEKRWALGRVHADLKEHLSDSYDFEWFDWSVYSRNEKLLIDGHWRLYDLILCNTVLVNGYLDGINPSLSQTIDFLKRLLIVSHFPQFEMDTFTEKIQENPLFLQYANYSGVSKETVRNLHSKYQIKAHFTPAGVNTRVFPVKVVDQVRPLKRVGFVGNPDVHENKGVKMFIEICKGVDLKPHYIYDREMTDNDLLYEGIDLLICCSKLEGNPLGIFEAAACGLPVLSTPVGNVVEIPEIETFKTTDEAINIINRWKADPNQLKQYTERVTSLVREQWNWKTIANKFWRPFIEKAETASLVESVIHPGFLRKPLVVKDSPFNGVAGFKNSANPVKVIKKPLSENLGEALRGKRSFY